MTKKEKDRRNRLLPLGVPKYVRIYDNGGTSSPNGSCDRYTVVFTGNYNNIGRPIRGSHVQSEHNYLAMSGAPYHPQGICLHGSTSWHCCDVNDQGWPPAIGRKNHLGRRIRFEDLPKDCQKITLDDYKELWEIKE